MGYLLVIFHVIAAKLQAMFGVYSDKDENDERHQYTAQKTLCESPIIRLVFNLPVAILTQVDVVISLGLSFFFGFEWLIDEDALESRHASCTIYNVCKMNMISYHLT